MRAANRPFCLLSSVALSSAVISGCLPSPKTDYEDFLDRTESYRTDDSDAASIANDSEAPKEAIKGLYYTSCLSELAYGDVRRVIRFYTVTEYTPSASGGTLSLNMSPLLAYDQAAKGPTAPPTFSMTYAKGAAIPASGTVDANAVFSISLGTVKLDPDANPITGRPITIETTQLKGLFASSSFCSTLSGQVTEPIQQPLSAPKNICLFVPLKDGDPLPEQDKAAFACNVP